MRVAQVICCDYHCVPFERRTYRNDAGWLAVSSSVRDTIADAVAHDHHCDDAGCDISEALSNGYVTAAYHLLVGATETPGCDAVLSALSFNLGDDAVSEALGVNLFASPDWSAWGEHHDEYGRSCDACGSITYADDAWEPERCANCLAALPVHDHDDESDEL